MLLDSMSTLMLCTLGCYYCSKPLCTKTLPNSISMHVLILYVLINYIFLNTIYTQSLSVLKCYTPYSAINTLMPW